MPGRPPRSAGRPRATARSAAGPLALPFADAFVDPFTGDFKTNKAYGIAAGVNHYWTPNWRTNVFGSWMRFDAPAVGQVLVPTNAATLAAGVAGTFAGVLDFNDYRIGANTIWSPVTGLQFGVEALYARVDPRGRVAVPLTDLAVTRPGSSSRRIGGLLGRPSAHPARLLSTGTRGVQLRPSVSRVRATAVRDGQSG